MPMRLGRPVPSRQPFSASLPEILSATLAAIVTPSPEHARVLLNLFVAHCRECFTVKRRMPLKGPFVDGDGERRARAREIDLVDGNGIPSTTNGRSRELLALQGPLRIRHNPQFSPTKSRADRREQAWAPLRMDATVCVAPHSRWCSLSSRRGTSGIPR